MDKEWIEQLYGEAPLGRLDDNFAGLKKDFQRDFPVIMPLNMFGTKLLECRHNLRQKRGFVPEGDHKQRIGIDVAIS
jgi:hypothetical protein